MNKNKILSSCCNAPLIYYSVSEKCFMDDDGNILISTKGIEMIDSLYKIIIREGLDNKDKRQENRKEK